MSLQRRARDLLSRAPALDAWFRRLIWSRIHFPEEELRFLAELPRASLDVAIDVGGALGSYAWPLSRKARRVIVFEPGEVHADFLSKALAFSRIELERAAVGNASGELDLMTPGDDVDARHRATLSASNPTIDATNAKLARVRVVTLDSFASDHIGASERVDLLKVDVEGFELAVFEGAASLIEQHHPLIFCEIEQRHNPRYREVFELLNRLGYVAFYIRGGQVSRLQSYDLAPLQTERALRFRISDHYKPGSSEYINNFAFEHPSSRIRISKGLNGQ